MDKITGPMHRATDTAEDMTRTVDETAESVGRLGDRAGETGGKLEKWGKGMFFFNQLKDGVDTITDAFNGAIEPGIRFETAVAEMSGITNLAGKDLENLADKARQTAKTFGSDAADATGLYTSLLSKLTPELKKAPDALQTMSDNVMTLSKTMKGDVAGATEAMVSAMNQFQVSMTDPAQAAKTMTEYMNIMAAGAVEGSSEVKNVAEALRIAGFTAHNAGISFAETNAAIQMLDKLGKYGSEGGTILRNIISRLDVQTSDANKQLIAAGVNIKQLHDHTLPLTDRLRALEPVMGNASLMQAVFGEEARSSATALIQNSTQVDTWTEAIQGTSAATDMAAKQMDTYAEKQKRMQAFIDDLKISFFEFVEPIAPVIEVIGIFVGTLVTLGTVAWSIGQIMTLVSIKSSIAWLAGMAKMVFSTVTSASAMTVAIASIPIVGWIAIAITAIGALVTYLWNKFAEVRAFFYGLWNFIKVIFTEYYRFIFNVMKAIVDVINPANWFDDDFHFSDVWDRLSKQALEGGKRVGSAFSDGWKEGMADWEKSHPPKEEKTEGSGLATLDMPLSPVIKPTPTNTGETSGKDVGLGGKGSGNGVKNITMNVTMNNHFNVSGESDYRKISERIKRELIAILSDVAPAAG